MGTLTAKPARTPMASQMVTGPRCAVTIFSNAPVEASCARYPKSMLPVETNTARNASRQGRGTGHGVDEELRGRRAAARASPELDEKESGDEAEFPEQKPVEEIERGERTEKAGLEDQDQAEVEVRLMMHAVRGIDRHERDDGGEHQHERAQAVDPR